MKNLIAITLLLTLGLMASGQTTIYFHDFGTTSISAHPYIVAPNTLDANLTSSGWSNSVSAWTSYIGSSGEALSLSNSGGTPSCTLTITISSGYQLSVNSFDFWRRRSSSGAQNWSMTIDGISVGSGSVPTSGSAIGNTNVANPVNGLTGTVDVVISLSGATGTGTFRLDDFTLTGTVSSLSSCTPPTNQASSASSSSVTSNSATISWTKGSGSDGSIVVLNAGSAVSKNPVSGSSYTASADWSSKGSALGSSADYVVFLNTSGTGVNLTNLDPATTYHYAIYDYMSSGTCFNITSPATGDFTTDCSTPDNVTGASSNPGNQQVEVSWTNGACFDEILVFVDETNGLGTSPSGNGTSYTANTVYSSAGQCVYKGTGTDVTVTGLTNSTTYYFEIYARKGTTWSSGVEVSGTPALKGLNVSSLGNAGAVLIDFDNTLSGVNNGQFDGSGFSASPSSGQLNSESWSISGLSDGTLNFDGTATSGDFANGSSTGGVTSGGIHAFQVASSDYALGVQPTSSDFADGSITLKTNNNTGSTVSHILIEYDVYIYNDQGRANDFDFSHSDDNSTYILVNNADLTSVEAAASTPAWERNSRKLLIAPSGGLSNGNPYYFRWSSDDVSGSGSRDEFALDNIRIAMYSSAPTTLIDTITTSPQASLVIDGIDAELGGDVTVDQLFLNDATLSLGSHTLTVNDSISGASSTAYIITDGNGSLRKSFSDTGSFDYPIGTSNGYSPVTLDFTSGTFSSAWAEARVVASVHSSNTSTTDYLNRYWALSQSGISGFACDITCTYLDGDVNGTESNIYAGKYSGSTWSLGNKADANNNTLSFDDATSFSDISGGEATALPVSWLEFKGTALPHHNLLEWSTAQEINNSHFMIERSGPDGQFINIGRVEGKGNVQGISNYQFADMNPMEDAFYRLKQVDFDGRTDFSRYERIHRNASDFPKGISIYPNPALHSIHIKGLEEKSTQQVNLYNHLGQNVKSWLDVQNEEVLDVSDLPHGMFWIEVRSGEMLLDRKMLIIKY